MTMPLDILERSLNKKVQLVLKDGRVMEGKLAGYDQHMNLVMDETEERHDERQRRLGTVILRGNNVVTITPTS